MKVLLLFLLKWLTLEWRNKEIQSEINTTILLTEEKTKGLLKAYFNFSAFLPLADAPEIKNISEVVAVAEGSDARLPCVADANPATEFTNWTRHRKTVRSARFAVLEKGALLIQDVRRTDAGEYSCTPYNKVGAGNTKITKLVLKGKFFSLCRNGICSGLHSCWPRSPFLFC